MDRNNDLFTIIILILAFILLLALSVTIKDDLNSVCTVALSHLTSASDSLSFLKESKACKL